MLQTEMLFVFNNLYHQIATNSTDTVYHLKIYKYGHKFQVFKTQSILLKEQCLPKFDKRVPNFFNEFYYKSR